MNKLPFIVSLGILVLGAVSCRRGVETPQAAVEAMMEDVVFTASSTDFLTKASDSSLEEKDEIGIFALDPIDAANVKGKVAQGGKVQPEVPIKWALKQTRPTRFAAYMPYDQALTAADYRFFVKQNQKAPEDYSASDLRYAVADTRPGDVVDFKLQHALSKLIVVMEDDSEIESVTTASEVVIGAGLNLVDGSIEPDPKKGTVSFGHEAIFIPQEGLFPLKIKLKNGEELERRLKVPATFESGIAYRAVIGLHDITFTVSITDWSDGGMMEYGKPKPVEL